MDRCRICGMDFSAPSMGGPGICPACDCGIAADSIYHPKNQGRAMKDHEVVELLNVLGGIKTALETRQKGIEAWLETLCGEVHSLGGSVLRVSHAVAALTQELHDQNPGKK